MQQALQALDRKYGVEDLPPHPRWCVRADQPRSACASGPTGGPFDLVTHESVDTSDDDTCFYLERTDFAGLGIGRVEIGFVVEDQGSWTIEEARTIAFDLLDVADRASAEADAG